MNIQELIKKPESKILEFKRELPKKHSKILKSIIAFANGSGGILCIGVDDNNGAGKK